MTVRVLFLQSQVYFGADSNIHALLMRYFDRAQVDVQVACTREQLADWRVNARDQLAQIPNLRVRLTNFGPSLFETAGIERLRRMAEAPLLPLSLLSLAGYIRRTRVHVLHGTEKPRDALFAVLLGKLTGARSIVHMHVAVGTWQSGVAHWALHHADGVIAISQFVAQSLLDDGHARDRIFVVHNALDAASSKWDPHIDGSVVRRELGVELDAPVVGIWSRMIKWKGHEHLLDALAIVHQRIPRVRLVIVGDHGDSLSASYRAQLEDQARRLGLHDSVIFTGFRTDIPQLLAAFDVCAVPSWEEPFGVVFLEAMAMEKPVVAWRSGGAPEIVVDGETGLLVEQGSVPALAEALMRLLLDPDLRRRLGQAGRQRVLQQFTPQRMCAGVLDVYNSLLGSARQPRRQGASARAGRTRAGTEK